jgi:Anti-sigma-K factor rskA/Putative zinc-finger
MRTPSAACAECRTLIGGYVLGALEPNETEQVRVHLAACPECAAEHARLADIPTLLAVAGGEEPAAERPPPALEEAVLDRFAHEHRTARRPAAGTTLRARLFGLLKPLQRPLPAATAGAFIAVLAAAVAIGIMPVGHSGGGSQETYSASLSGLSVAPAAHASARLQTSSAGTHVNLKVSGLRGNPDDVYELWCVRDDGTKISAGTFRVDPRGQAIVQMTTAAVPGEYHHMSVERRSLAPGAGRPVMAGEIHYSSS